MISSIIAFTVLFLFGTVILQDTAASFRNVRSFQSMVILLALFYFTLDSGNIAMISFSLTAFLTFCLVVREFLANFFYSIYLFAFPPEFIAGQVFIIPGVSDSEPLTFEKINWMRTKFRDVKKNVVYVPNNTVLNGLIEVTD